MLYNIYFYNILGGDSMVKSKKIVNPLTIIGIFATLAEVAMVTALGLISEELQPTFIWFVMGFTVFLVSLFFITLNFNAKVLYAPSDFQDEKHFIETIGSVKVETNTLPEKFKEMQLIVKKHFKNQEVVIDNKNFDECTFENCKLVYKGIGGIGINNCMFNNVSWTFDKNAAQVLSFLAKMYSDFGEGGKRIFDSTVENMKNGVY